MAVCYRCMSQRVTDSSLKDYSLKLEWMLKETFYCDECGQLLGTFPLYTDIYYGVLHNAWFFLTSNMHPLASRACRVTGRNDVEPKLLRYEKMEDVIYILPDDIEHIWRFENEGQFTCVEEVIANKFFLELAKRQNRNWDNTMAVVLANYLTSLWRQWNMNRQIVE
jgi:hypothetical protein